MHRNFQEHTHQSLDNDVGGPMFGMDDDNWPYWSAALQSPDAAFGLYYGPDGAFIKSAGEHFGLKFRCQKRPRDNYLLV